MLREPPSYTSMFAIRPSRAPLDGAVVHLVAIYLTTPAPQPRRSMSGRWRQYAAYSLDWTVSCAEAEANGAAARCEISTRMRQVLAINGICGQSV
jgi:hypothetical protein